MARVLTSSLHKTTIKYLGGKINVRALYVYTLYCIMGIMLSSFPFHTTVKNLHCVDRSAFSYFNHQRIQCSSSSSFLLVLLLLLIIIRLRFSPSFPQNRVGLSSSSYLISQVVHNTNRRKRKLTTVNMSKRYASEIIFSSVLAQSVYI